MKSTVFVTALALACVGFVVSPAEARKPRSAPVEACNGSDIMRPCMSSPPSSRGFLDGVVSIKVEMKRERASRPRRTSLHAPIGARPRAWCGWWMRQHLGVADPAGNLARWWASYGSRSHGPAVGALVVWRHHVGIITAQAGNGRWVVKSGNDGNAVRERPRSLAGAIAFRHPA